MYISAGKVNGLFHIEAVNHKFNQNTEGREEKGVSLRSDIAMISQNGKAMSARERLMRQKDFIRECKDSLIEQMIDKESGSCSADVVKKIEEYEKQLDSLDEQIAKELAEQEDGSGEIEEKNTCEGNRPLTEEEVDYRKMAELTEMSVKLSQGKVIDSVRNRLEGEKNVLEAELKSGDSDSKRQRVEEIEINMRKMKI